MLFVKDSVVLMINSRLWIKYDALYKYEKKV